MTARERAGRLVARIWTCIGRFSRGSSGGLAGCRWVHFVEAMGRGVLAWVGLVTHTAVVEVWTLFAGISDTSDGYLETAITTNINVSFLSVGRCLLLPVGTRRTLPIKDGFSAILSVSISAVACGCVVLERRTSAGWWAGRRA